MTQSQGKYITSRDGCYDIDGIPNRNKKDMNEMTIITINIPTFWRDWIDKYVALYGNCSRSEFVRSAIGDYLIKKIDTTDELQSREREMDAILNEEGYVYVPNHGYVKIVRRLE